MSKQIFISHAVNDKALADAFVDLLQTGLNLRSDDVFCSSLEGLGIPAGENFIDHIKDQIQAPKLVVAIISRNYLSSQFCMCELGAAWAMSHKLLPLLVPPLQYQDVQGVLKATQLERIDNHNDLSQFAECLNDIFPSLNINIARWNVKAEKFTKNIPILISECAAPNTIPIVEYENLKKELLETRAALEEINDENEILSNKIKELALCKDASEVREVQKKFSSEEAQFDEYIEDCSSALDKLPRIVSLVLCRSFGTGTPVLIDPYKDDIASEEANDAVSKQYLKVEGKFYELNDDHPKIKKISAKLDKLERFLHDISEDFITSFEDANDFPLSLDNREFWEWGLDQRIGRFAM
ncbi:toll/interleukin-1 receptor domain-containing protein [Enterobacter kobei]|nr:TIR domain-containing protein [Enterobacter ludwigii]